MRSLLKDQSGIALVMSVGMIAVLSIVGTTTLVYTTSNARSGVFSKDNERAFSLAEAGLNNAMAVLSLPTNNALDSTLLPSTEATASSSAYEGGTSKWYGTLDRAAAMWTITSLGLYDNPTGNGVAQVRRKLVAKVPIIPTNTQTNNNPAWNYIYARATGSPCDVTLSNNLSGQSRFYVAGNLCLDNNVDITSESLIVQGNLDLSNNADVGTSGSRVEGYVGGNCRYGGGSWATPCTGNQDSRHIYSKLMPSGSVGVNNTAPVIPEPTADLALWYEDAAPGPAQSCTASSGTPPTFDNNYPNRNNSLGTFELTPASSYMCRVGPGANTTLSGAMNASQTTLSVASSSGFPTTTFRIRVDDEQMNVTGGFGTNTWTVARGVNGTTAASHVTSQTLTWDDSNTIGMILWNATTKTLTVKGTIFIDGSASITNGSLQQVRRPVDALPVRGLLHQQLVEALRRRLRLGLRLRRLEPEQRAADGRHELVGWNCRHGERDPRGQQRPVPGRALRGVRRAVRQQRALGRPDRRPDREAREQRSERPVPDDHVGPRRDAGQPDRLRAAEPAAAVRRLTAKARRGSRR